MPFGAFVILVLRLCRSQLGAKLPTSLVRTRSPLATTGRACGELRSPHGRDVAGHHMIGLSLARSYICGATSCPPRGSWFKDEAAN
jgi:hypothetical protein